MNKKEVKDVVSKSVLSSSKDANGKISKKILMQYFALFVIILFVNLPVVSAIEISGVSAEDVTSDSVVIYWETNETADSSVYYSTSSSGFDDNLIGQESGSSEVTDHTVQISALEPETEYFYYVESDSVIENNTGSYYSFTTSAEEVIEEVEDEGTDYSEEDTETADTTEDGEESSEDSSSSSLELVVDEIPEIVQGDEVDITGDSTDGAEIRVYVNGGYHSKYTCDETGDFSFSNVPLEEDSDNTIDIETTNSDSSLTESYSTTVYSDNTHPEITVANYQEDTDYVTEDETVTFSIKVSEESTLEIEVNEHSEYSENELGTTFQTEIHLEEGDNKVTVRATDEAGWESEVIIDIESDTMAPEVEAEIEKGTEFYQNRAESNIHGTAEEGATVYLYVYRPLSYEYSPDFDDPWMKTTAGEDGSFTFEEVNFESEPLSFEDFTPTEVPSDLEAVSIYPMESASQSQNWNYEVFILAEDETGKVGYWRDGVSVHTCYSENFDFQITDLVEFQQPLRLNPSLIEDGREMISAVFNLSYKGTGAAQYNMITGEEEQAAFQVSSVKIEKACTQSMMEDEKFSLGCKILPNSPTKMISSPDGTAYYLNWDLHSTGGLDEIDTDFWNELKNSQVVFPLKVYVNYQEYDSQGNLGSSKTQTSCYDLGYYVDVPIDSTEMIPDWLADESMDALNYTIDKIDKVLPYLEKAMIATGISCFIMVGSKTVVRIARMFTSKAEYLKDRAISEEDDDQGEKCPLNQNSLYLDSTIEAWQYLDGTSTDSPGAHPDLGISGYGLPDGYDGAHYSESKLSDRCPSTASLWEVESKLESAYRWTCDRFLCRSVPAKWTYDEEKDKIDSVIVEQKSCASTAGCTPVRKIENCDTYINENNLIGLSLSSEVTTTGGTCWEVGSTELSANGNSEVVQGSNLFVKDGDQPFYDKYGIVNLKRVTSALSDVTSVDHYLVYEEKKGSDNFCAAPDKTCEQLCNSERVNGYQAISDGYKLTYPFGWGSSINRAAAGESSGSSTTIDVESSGGPCYKKEGEYYYSPPDENGEKQLVRGDKYAAGFSSDCFIDDNATFYQCVCEGEDDVEKNINVRTAVKAETVRDEILAEEYLYRQDQLYQESFGLTGTYYPDWRYYKGRDLPGAFGANYLIDYVRPGEEKHHEINPNTQFIGMFQTVCLTRIRASLVMLRSILDGLRTCINEAKYTGFADAGMCKTLFSQHVCGLAYKLVASFNSDCSPFSFNDVGKEGDLNIGDYASAGTDSIYAAMDSSINDLKADYDNAALDNYLGGGVQGVAQSMCMAMFGYDFPMGLDFIQDVAYSVPMKTTVMVFPAYRELTNYNPETLTAIHNYEIGTVVFPGCEIQSYQTYLTCVGQEDLSHPGVECTDQGCDCVSASTMYRENEKDYSLEGGYGSNIERGSMVDLPITSPQKVDSDFRYDHVVVQLNLAQNEDPNSCFDEGYRDGKFYFPIKDVSPPATVSCQVESTTGKYSCPELSSLFYSDGLAYLQDPYITCYNKDNGNYVDCDTPNMFIEGDEIKAKIHYYTDDQGYCLRLTTSGVAGMSDEYRDQVFKIPGGANGGASTVYNLGTVSSSMFGGRDAGLYLSSSESASGCSDTLTPLNSVMITTSQKVTFEFDVSNGNKFALKEPSSVSVKSSGYKWSNGYLTDSSGNKYMDRSEINGVEFTYAGIEFKNVLGNAVGSQYAGRNKCVYQPQAAQSVNYAYGNTQNNYYQSNSYYGGSSYGNYGNSAQIRLSAELLQRGVSDNCYDAKEKVQVGDALGKSSHTETIVVQKEHEAEMYTSEIHSNFQMGNYEKVMELAEQKIDWNPGSLSEATGLYYYVAAYILDGSEITNDAARFVGIEPLLNRFFLRQTSTGAALAKYDVDVNNTAEFQKIRRYLCQVAEYRGISANYVSSEVNCNFETVGSSTTT